MRERENRGLPGEVGLFARISCTEIDLGQRKSQLWGQDILNLLAMTTTARSGVAQPPAAWSFSPRSEYSCSGSGSLPAEGSELFW